MICRYYCHDLGSAAIVSGIMSTIFFIFLFGHGHLQDDFMAARRVEHQSSLLQSFV